MGRFVLLLPFILYLATACGQLSGKAVKIGDGDSFTVLTEDNRSIRVRLHGVDSPERGQDFGNAARKFTRALLEGETITLQVKDRDQYDRLVVIATLSNGKVINEELLKAGYAWHFKRFDNNPVWAELERQARRQRLGLWVHDHPIAPWVFRRRKVSVIF